MRLLEFVEGFPKLREIAVSYSTERDEAEKLAENIKASFPQAPLYLTRVGPVLGTHGGPGAMGVAVRDAEDDTEQG